MGRSDIRVAVTEGNMTGPGTPLIGTPLEHGLGRALAEAAIFPERCRAYSMLVHHDLVRSNRDTWFCRVLYDPEGPPGQRYSLPPDGAVMRIAGEHARNLLVAADVPDLWAVSASSAEVLLTLGNPLSVPRLAQFTFPGLGPLAVTESRAIQSAGLDSLEYETRPWSCQAEGATLSLRVPPFAFGWVRLRNRLAAAATPGG
jgi:hypothetical protein